MTGHDIIKQLREMELKATKAPWKCDRGMFADFDITADSDDFIIQFIDSDKEDPEFITEMRNNADLLLSIAEAFRPGDVGRLARLEHYVDKHLVGCQYDDEDNAEWLKISYAISRLQVAAERLEGKP